MKIIVTDLSNNEHDLDKILVEFAQLHAQALTRIAAIENDLGIEPNTDPEPENDENGSSEAP